MGLAVGLFESPSSQMAIRGPSGFLCAQRTSRSTPKGHGRLTRERVDPYFLYRKFLRTGPNRTPGPVFGRFGYDGPGRSGRVSCEFVMAHEGACGGVGASNDHERLVDERSRSIGCNRVENERARVGAVFRPAGRVFANEENGNAGLFRGRFVFV